MCLYHRSSKGTPHKKRPSDANEACTDEDGAARLPNLKLWRRVLKKGTNLDRNSTPGTCSRAENGWYQTAADCQWDWGRQGTRNRVALCVTYSECGESAVLKIVTLARSRTRRQRRRMAMFCKQNRR